MAPREPQPRPLPKPPPEEIIPPDPPPDPPDAVPPPSTKPAAPAKRSRDRTRESHPDFGDVRRVPRKSDPPIITGRVSTEKLKRDAGTCATWHGYSLLQIPDY